MAADNYIKNENVRTTEAIMWRKWVAGRKESLSLTMINNNKTIIKFEIVANLMVNCIRGCPEKLFIF